MVTQEEALKCEKQLYLSQGIKPNNFEQKMIQVSEGSYISTIILNKIPKESKKQLLLVHGYNACKGNMFRLAELLHEYFYVVIIDLPGMNLSHKPDKIPFGCLDSALDFFMQSLINFVKQLNLENFYLVAHSLGAFLSTHLFNHMSQNIKKLLLISPCGFNQSSENEYEYQIDKLKKERWFFTRYFIHKYGMQIFRDKKSAQEVIPKAPKWLVKYLIKQRFKLTEKQSEYLSVITQYNFQSSPCGERCFGHLFDYGIRSKKPIIQILEKYKDRLEDVCIFWGENDYMDKQETKQSLQEKDMKIKTYIITKSKHSIQNENFTDLADHILKFTLDINVKTQRYRPQVIKKQKSEIYNQDHEKEKKQQYQEIITRNLNRIIKNIIT